MSLLLLCSVYCAALRQMLILLLPFTGDTERWAHRSLFTVASAGPPGAARGLANVAGGCRRQKEATVTVRKRRNDVKMKRRNKSAYYTMNYVMNGSGGYFCTNFIRSELVEHVFLMSSTKK
jgi:hypothetical protein